MPSIRKASGVARSGMGATKMEVSSWRLVRPLRDVRGWLRTPDHCKSKEVGDVWRRDRAPGLRMMHRTAKLRAKAASGSDLYQLNERLRLLVKPASFGNSARRSTNAESSSRGMCPSTVSCERVPNQRRRSDGRRAEDALIERSKDSACNADREKMEVSSRRLVRPLEMSADGRGRP